MTPAPTSTEPLRLLHAPHLHSETLDQPLHKACHVESQGRGHITPLGCNAALHVLQDTQRQQRHLHGPHKVLTQCVTQQLVREAAVGRVAGGRAALVQPQAGQIARLQAVPATLVRDHTGTSIRHEIACLQAVSDRCRNIEDRCIHSNASVFCAL